MINMKNKLLASLALVATAALAPAQVSPGTAIPVPPTGVGIAWTMDVLDPNGARTPVTTGTVPGAGGFIEIPNNPALCGLVIVISGSLLTVPPVPVGPLFIQIVCP